MLSENKKKHTTSWIKEVGGGKKAIDLKFLNNHQSTHLCRLHLQYLHTIFKIICTDLLKKYTKYYIYL